MITETEKAWLAGILDGEGSIAIRRHKSCDSVLFRFALYNTNPVIVSESKRMLEQILGCPVYVYTIKRAKTHRLIYHVVIGSRHKIARVLTELLPYIRGKKREAEIILAAYALCPKRSGGWNRWGRPIPLSSQVDVLLAEFREERQGRSTVGNPEPSCAGAIGSAEGATATGVTPKNNPPQERAASLNLFRDDEIA
jgi:hypothetical protein